jgi:hypothetical protein
MNEEVKRNMDGVTEGLRQGAMGLHEGVKEGGRKIGDGVRGLNVNGNGVESSEGKTGFGWKRDEKAEGVEVPVRSAAPLNIELSLILISSNASSLYSGRSWFDWTPSLAGSDGSDVRPRPSCLFPLSSSGFSSDTSRLNGHHCSFVVHGIGQRQL